MSDARDDKRCEDAARRFHEIYEELAPLYGWETQPKSRVEWDVLPSEQRGLMLETVKKVLAEFAPSHALPMPSREKISEQILADPDIESSTCAPSTTPQKEVPAGYVEECEAVIQHLSGLLHDVRYDRNGWRERVLDFSNNGVKETALSATERNAVIEECAAIADYLYENGADTDGSVLLVDCSNKIRDLKNRADGGKASP